MTEDKRPNDLLSAWVSACDSDTQVMDEMLSVLLVGHDASSACIAWTAYLLMKNPEVQQQLALEVDACRSDDDLQRAPLLTAVLKESMRLCVGSLRRSGMMATLGRAMLTITLACGLAFAGTHLQLSTAADR